ncbi:MAG: FAD-dependent oxidoreductase [Gemmatimonadota bacterium]|nr:FAD-dependent oxidoreductase [Gemmatimonadota bacterium]MDH3421849.1 FAD-dependent oxidoreductase [Gemmatimonadota bacterium]
MKSRLGTEDHPLRVAIIGSGPAGFYVAEHLLKSDVAVHVDMFDRLPTPFGLVRFGVAPDHQKIKSVTRVFDRIAKNESFRFYGNVEVGRDISLDDLKDHYHQVCFATGAQTDRQMGIPGEDLPRSHAATEFVAWFNGHPDYCDCEFDLSAERVAVIGVGNVAVDVARILCRTPEELAATDIADHALEALRNSKVREVYMIGRRGPMQAAFTNPEARELGELAGADIYVPADEAELDPLSAAELEGSEDDTVRKKVAIVQDFAGREREGKPRLLTLRFLVSPTELIPGDDGGVRAMRLEKNVLVADGERTSPRGTGQTEDLPVDLVFRSVGYRGIPIEGLPFHERWGVIPNEKGRVTRTEVPVPGMYVSGWIKRGPTGVIGTNKKDGTETATAMLEDVEAAAVLDPTQTDPATLDALVRRRQPEVVTYEDWARLDEIELSRGKECGRPRVKLTSRAEIQAALANG